MNFTKEKPQHHKAPIVRIKSIRPHPNADTLSLIDIEGYQCVVKTGEFKEDDLAVYVYPDSVVPQTPAFRFIWEGQKGLDGLVPEKRRRITVRRFRKEWSEGLLMPITAFAIDVITIRDFVDHFTFSDGSGAFISIREGQDVSDLLGITHYEPEVAAESTAAKSLERSPRRKYPKSLKGWFYFILYKLGLYSSNGCAAQAMDVDLGIPVFDVEALKNYRQAFQDGEPVIITEKIHGSNARYVFIDGEFYAGSHYQWKAKGEGIWWKVAEQHPWIEEWCKANPGSTLYGEVVPTQKGFDYGCKPGETKFFAFAILSTERKWRMPFTITVPSPSSMLFGVLFEKGIQSVVPIIATGMPFNFEELKRLAEGPSLVENTSHIREGVVVTPVNEREVHRLGRLVLKLVSNAFLEKDSKQ